MKMALVCLEESNIVKGEHLQHVIQDRKLITTKKSPEQSYSLSFVEKVRTFARNAFLPEGFPESVSEDYLSYQIWDTVQAFASSISGSLATQAVLEGIGVGDEKATSLAATITWLLRHGAGMIGSIVFTWMQGSDLDYNCKKWRLFADIANDFAMCLELSGPFWPSEFFQYVLCLASVSRALVGVAGGATRTAITQHQAKADNISDVAAKDGSQETLVNLAALIVNLYILPLVSGDKSMVWMLFFAMTILHLFANYKAVTSLVFNTLNKDRLLVILDGYFKTKRIKSPKEVNLTESPFLGFGKNEESFCKKMKIKIGVPLKPHLQASIKEDEKEILQILDSLTKENYVIFSKGKSLNIVLSSSHTGNDMLKAYCQSFYMATNDNDEEEFNFEELESALQSSGWDSGSLLVVNEGWKIKFQNL